MLETCGKTAQPGMLLNVKMPVFRTAKNRMMMGYAVKTETQRLCEVNCMVSAMKIEMGILFPFHWYACLDLIDKIKKTKYYRHSLKHALKEYLEVMRQKRIQLLNPPSGMLPMFDPRRVELSMYGYLRQDLTKEEYYDYWENNGILATKMFGHLIDSMEHKWFKALRARGVECAKELSWLLTGHTMTTICSNHFQDTIKRYANSFKFAEDSVSEYFKMFDLSLAASKWHKAMECMVPDNGEVLVESLEDRNVALGLVQLLETIIEPKNVLQIERQNIVENRDVFVSKAKWLEYISMIDADISGLTKPKVMKEKEAKETEGERKEAKNGKN